MVTTMTGDPVKSDDGGVNATLLMVEDDPRIRAALGMALADHGYRVVEAETGERALSILGRPSRMWCCSI